MPTSKFSAFSRPLSALLIASSLGGCAALSKQPSTSDDASQAGESSDELRSQVVSLNARIESLESKLASMADKVDATQAAAEISMSRNGKSGVKSPSSKSALDATPGLDGVAAHPSEGLGESPATEAAASDPEAGFTQDDAILQFRKSIVLYQSKKFSESVLAFASFVERYPDHPIAGAAQYYVGASYLKQGEYRLALTELQRVLTSYDRSHRVPDALRDMVLAEEALKRNGDAARHRQLLTSVFPQSPASSSLEAAADNGLAPVPTAPVKETE